MFSESVISPTMIQAYKETLYRVFADPPFALRIGIHSPELAAAHETRRVSCSAFITAFNPCSHALSPAENELRHQALVASIGGRDLGSLEGVGQHPTNGWPGEKSLLIFGLSLDEARAVGNEFEQNAIVWSGPDAVPQLILLR